MTTLRNSVVVVIGGILFLSLGVTNQIHAVTNPLESANNKYGIHIINEADISNAAKLVNSTGGDWGYVTMVITETERSTEKWNAIFDQLRENHLIPIVRIATKPQGSAWIAPSINEASVWADFLSSLKWVTTNRYIVIFNEPNHAKEWGLTLSPEEYADILSSYSQALKQKSDDFFILPAGLDASAPNGHETMSEQTFLSRMVDHNPTIFEKIDGWTSHSYPNPNFSGKASAKGKGTLASYLWELEYLKELGATKELPVFITETGWAHREGITQLNGYLSSDAVGQEFSEAARSVWIDPQIVALTPFILNYQSYPFSNFSWQLPNSSEFYSFFLAYQNIEKTKGQPSLIPLPTITPIKVLGLAMRDNVSGEMNMQPQGKGLLLTLLHHFASLPLVSKFISTAI